jgi:hypothetical protein
MPSVPKEIDGKTQLIGCAYILENISFHAGDAELFSALFEVGEWKEFMTQEIEERIKAALRLPVYKRKEVLQIFKTYRKDFPREDWWWYPERL